MNKVFKTGIMIMMLVLSACNEQDLEVAVSQVPDAEEILKLDPNADIFQWNDRVYKAGIDWVDKLELTKNKEIGEITSISPDPENYKNGMANKLPIGAKIYTAKERQDVLLVELNGNVINYLGASEG